VFSCAITLIFCQRELVETQTPSASESRWGNFKKLANNNNNLWEVAESAVSGAPKDHWTGGIFGFMWGEMTKQQ